MGGESPKPANTPTGAVFLSHASQDADAAKGICDALRAAGIEVWFDQSELRGGDAWDQSIRKQIKNCTLFIPVVSRHTHERAEGYFRLEWKLAVDRSHLIMANKAFLLPIVIDDTGDDDENVPDKFREVQWTRLPGGQTSPAFIERVQRLLAGEASTSRLITPQPVPRRTFTKTVAWGVGAIAALACAYFITNKYSFLKHPIPTTPAAAPVAQQTAPRADTAAAFNAPPHSIAVLPFVNISGDRDQEYFADGLTEEMIDHLAQAGNLKVIARTSSFQFKGRNEDVRTIAAKLSVANLLEGSVRRSGKTLRITAQLVRASDGFHIWSHTYERSLNDTFKVQNEIAEAVTRGLNVALTQTVSPTASQVNFEAYDLVLQGNFLKRRGNAEDLARAIALYKQAIQIDPRYALAWARLGSAYLNQVVAAGVSVSEGLPRARAALQHAVELDPALIWAHYTMAGVYMTELNWADAAAEIARMQELDPNNKEPLLPAEADIYRVWCRLPEAIRINHELVERDPLSTYGWADLAVDQFFASQLDDSIDSYRHLIALAPAYAGAQAGLGQALAFAGRHSEALAATQKESNQVARLKTLPIVYWAGGDRTRSDMALRELVTRQSEDWYGIAAVYAYRGQLDEALDWLDRAYQHYDSNLGGVKCDPLLRNLQREPRYQALLGKLHFNDALPLPTSR